MFLPLIISAIIIVQNEPVSDTPNFHGRKKMSLYNTIGEKKNQIQGGGRRRKNLTEKPFRTMVLNLLEP